MRIFRKSATLRFSLHCYGARSVAQTLVVSGRGQITLPVATRKRLGIKGGDVVILEDRGNELVLKPGVVLEVQYYSDDDVAQWDAEDRLEEGERTRLLEVFDRVG